MVDIISHSGASRSTSSSPPFDLPQLEQHRLFAENGTEYRIIVGRPHAQAPAEGYRVIYVLDGNAWTSIISEVIRINQRFAGLAHVEPTLVVGIGYPTAEAFDIEGRVRDLTTPWSGSAMLEAFGWSHIETGGADRFLDFITTVVKPDIEARFPVNVARQTLFGHSLGGLFTLRNLFQNPRNFSSYVAVSPALWWEGEALLEQFRTWDAAKAGAPLAELSVFIGVGDVEENLRSSDIEGLRKQISAMPKFRDRDPVEALDEMLRLTADARYVTNATEITKRLIELGIRTECVNFPDEDHFSVLPAAISRSLHFLGVGRAASSNDPSHERSASAALERGE